MSPKEIWENADNMDQLQKVTDHIDKQKAELEETRDETKQKKITEDIKAAEQFVKETDEILTEALKDTRPEAKA